VKYGIFPLHDVLPSPVQLVHGLINLRKSIAGERYSGIFYTSDVGLTLVKVPARASSAIQVAENEVGPLPGATFAASSLAASIVNSPGPLGMPETMIPGQWTIIIVHEYDHRCSYRMIDDIPKKMRYAFVSRMEDDPKLTHSSARYKVLDRKKYLLEVCKASAVEGRRERQHLLKEWDQRGKDLMGSCDECEIHEMIPVLEKEAGKARTTFSGIDVFVMYYGFDSEPGSGSA